MSEATDSVKPVIAGLRELATKNAKSQHGPKFDSWADHIAALVKRTKELERLTTALPQTLGDLSDLPDELRDELSIAEGDELGGAWWHHRSVCCGCKQTAQSVRLTPPPQPGGPVRRAALEG